MKSDIRRANRHSIRAAIRGLTLSLHTGDWLPSGHPYAAGIPKGRHHDGQAMAEYVALSAIQHAFDGWAYWGRAVAAEVSGDSNIASHLGYYAELRAAKAILASEGIGLSSNRVAVVDGSRRCDVKREQGSSHQLLWQVIEAWSNGNADGVVFGLLKPFGHSIADWLQHFPGSYRPVAEDWLRAWGLDLQALATDGSRRNVASYDPSGFPLTMREKSATTLDHLTRLWQSCEPTGTGVSLTLDRLVLRATLETVFRTSHPYGRSAKQAPKQYREKVRHAVESLALGGPSRLGRANRQEAILSFLDPREVPEGMDIFEIARRTSDARTKTHVSEVLSRAVLLLRLATACAHDLLTEFGSDPRAVTKFWWDSRHVRRGLWPSGHTLDSFSDLWDEADEALDTLRQQQNGISTFKLRSLDCASSIATLATAERIFLWGSFAA